MVAVVAQESEKVKRYIEETGLPFNILIDSSRDTLRAYGVWHRLGMQAWNIARPALFIIAADGRIVRIWVGESQEEFPTHGEIEEALPDSA